MNSIDRRLARLRAKIGPIDNPIAEMAARMPTTIEHVEIYFLECGDWIKIGRSKCGNKRIADIDNLIPYPVTFLGSFIGIPQDEIDLHVRFRELRHKGEWFRKTAELMGAVDKLCREGEARKEHDWNENVGISDAAQESSQ